MKQCTPHKHKDNMPTIYYRTFPLSKDHSLSSPSSIPVPCPMSLKRNTVVEPISLGRPAKIPKHEEQKNEQNAWICPSSMKTKRTGNNNTIQRTIQPIIDEIKPGCHRKDTKEPISLASADTFLRHIPPCAKAMEAMVQGVLRKPQTSCYTHACGSPEARLAIALHHSCLEHKLSPENVVVTNGCSGALELSLSSLLDPGTTLLVPKPGLPLYEEIAESIGANVIHYRLNSNKDWECDIDHLEEIMEGRKRSSYDGDSSPIRAIAITNPSTHGSVFSRDHLVQILNFAFKHRLPIVSDEVYGDLTFGSSRFYPMAQIAAECGRRVPIVTTSGLSKQFLIPGWRVGWVAFQDNTVGSLQQVEQGALRLASLQHGVSHLQQSAIPVLLSTSTPGLASWKANLRSTLERQAKVLISFLQKDCHSCFDVRSPPQGAMYTIVHIELRNMDDTIENDMDFCQKLVLEENVFVLPGSSFGVPGAFRVAFSAHERSMKFACQRIANFCRNHKRHERLSNSTNKYRSE